MPVINVMLWSGRSDEQKARIASRMTQCMVEEAQVPAESVVITFQDFLKSDWAEGGIMASEKIRINNGTHSSL